MELYKEAVDTVKTVNNAVPAPSPRLCWAAGWDAYVRRRPYTAMVDEHMRKGWLAANAAEAGMLTPGYAESMGY